jgi:type II secretory ATPase GspE/PulE/Tfp pilus assembly ATPase PilB-like protein
LQEPVGCARCRGTGYYDRIGIFEVVTPDDAVLRVIEDGGSESEIRLALRSHGIPDLQTEAMKNAAAGMTSFAESTRFICID